MMIHPSYRDRPYSLNTQEKPKKTKNDLVPLLACLGLCYPLARESAGCAGTWNAGQPLAQGQVKGPPGARVTTWISYTL